MARFRFFGLVAILVALALVAGGLAYVKLTSKPASPVDPLGIGISEQGGAPNLAEDQVPCPSAPVNCATGEFWEQLTDYQVPGRGVPLDLTQTYVSADAARPSVFGYGWSDSYGMSLTPPGASGKVTVRQENGATVTFTENAAHEFTAPPRVMATLTVNRAGQFIFTRDSQAVSYVFSSAGKLISERDPDGDQTTLRYSGSLLKSVTDAAHRQLTFSYTHGHVTTITGPMRATTRLAYTGGYLTKLIDPAGRTWKFGYGGAHLLTSVTDPRGLVTRITYDPGHRVTALSGPGNAKTTYQYAGDSTSPAGGATTVTGPGGMVTTYHYYEFLLTSERDGPASVGDTTWYAYNLQTLVTSVTDPDGHITSYTYDKRGDELTSTDPLNRTTTYTYNALGEVTSQTLPSGAVTRSWYDARGNPVKTEDADGNVTTYAPDPADPALPSRVSGPGGATTAFTYDRYGDTVSATTSPSPGVTDVTRYAYDASGAMTCEASPDATARHITCPAPPPDCPALSTHTAGTTSYALDCDGEVTAVTDPAGDVTRSTYDADGEVTTVTDPTGTITGYQYDDQDRPTATTVNGTVTSAQTYNPAGSVATQTSSPGQVTKYQYNLLGRLIAMTDPVIGTTRYSYDPAGNLTRTVAPSGQPTYYAYDAADELTAEGGSPVGTPAATISYTPDGQQAQVSNAAGTISYAYDADQRLLAATQTSPASVADGYSYTYADAAHRVSLTYPNGHVATSFYDKAGELTKVTDWLGNSMTFGYDASGNLTAETLPGGITISYGSSAITVARDGTTMAVIAYARNNDGLVSEAVAAGVPDSSGSVAHYSYTPRGELAADGSLSYSYDQAGNLASASTGAGFKQSFNAADELTTRISGGITTDFSYDADGDLTGTSNQSGPTATLNYNQASQLTSADTLSSSASYTYDAAGLLATSAEASGAGSTSQTGFTWDQAQAMPLLLATTSQPSPPPAASPADSTGASTSGAQSSGSATPADSAPAAASYTSYVYGPAGQPVEQITGDDAVFLVADQQGSIRLLLNAAGREVGAVTYDPYGNVTGRTGDATTAFGYDGQYTDPATGYIYLRARYYDPRTGQFLTRDPEAAATGEPYSYAGGDPVNASDPTGLSWWNPFTWTAKTWANIGIGAALAVGAVFTDGADLSLAPEAFGAEAAADVAGDTLAEGGLSEGLAADDGEQFMTVYRFHTASDPTTLMSRLSSADADVQEQVAAQLESPDEATQLAVDQMTGNVKDSPFVSVVADPAAAVKTTDGWLRMIIDKAPNLSEFSVPVSRLTPPLTDLSVKETEWVFLGDDLSNYLVQTLENPYKGTLAGTY